MANQSDKLDFSQPDNALSQIAEEQRIVEEQKLAEDRAQQRKLQTAIADIPVDNSSKSFNGEGNKLSDTSDNKMSVANVREARLKFYQDKNMDI